MLKKLLATSLFISMVSFTPAIAESPPVAAEEAAGADAMHEEKPPAKKAKKSKHKKPKKPKKASGHQEETPTESVPANPEQKH